MKEKEAANSQCSIEAESFSLPRRRHGALLITANSTPHLGQVGPARSPAYHENSNWCAFPNNEKSELPVPRWEQGSRGVSLQCQGRNPANNPLLSCALEARLVLVPH